MGLKHRHAGETGCGDDHPERREAARAAPVGDQAGERRRDEHPDRERRELEAGHDRRLSLRPLEIEDEEEHQGEAREPVDECGRGRSAEQPVLEERQIEHRRATAALDDDEERQQDHGGDEAADHERVAPTGETALREGQHEPGEADDVGGRPEQVEPSFLVAARHVVQDEICPHRAGDSERQVEPEDPRPRDRDERAAEHRPDHEPDGGDHRVRPHREPELLLRERVGHERRRVGEEERAADALQHTPEDQLRAAAGEPGAERRCREDDEAEHVRVLPAEEVGEPAGGEHEHRRHDHVDEDHPHELEKRRVQAPLQIRQRDDQRSGVHGREQHPETRAGEHPPLVMLAVTTCP